MASDQTHRQRAPRPPIREAAGRGEESTRSLAHDHGAARGDHGMLAMLACCIAIGSVFLLIALGVS